MEAFVLNHPGNVLIQNDKLSAYQAEFFDLPAIFFLSSSGEQHEIANIQDTRDGVEFYTVRRKKKNVFTLCRCEELGT